MKEKRGLILELILLLVVLLILFLVLLSYSNKREYKVTFITNTSVNIDSVYVKANALLKEPLEPAREDYDFLGWYEGKEKYDFKKPVTHDLTLEARWKEHKND